MLHALLPCSALRTLKQTFDSQRLSWRYLAHSHSRHGTSPQAFWNPYCTLKASELCDGPFPKWEI